MKKLWSWLTDGDRPPAAPMIRPMPRPLTFDLQWGGYYAIRRSDGGWGVIRLLDLNRRCRHCTLYRHAFRDKPTLEEARALHPFILHVPMAASGLLLENDVTLLGAAPLTRDDLAGYSTYLELQDVQFEKIEELVARSMRLSKEGPSRLTIGPDLDDDSGIVVTGDHPELLHQQA